MGFEAAIFSSLVLFFITITYFIIGLTVSSPARTKVTFIFASGVLLAITFVMVIFYSDHYAGREDAIAMTASLGAIILVIPVAALTFGMIISRFIRSLLKKK